jgi:hypothetical protein
MNSCYIVSIYSNYFYFCEINPEIMPTHFKILLSDQADKFLRGTVCDNTRKFIP